MQNLGIQRQTKPSVIQRTDEDAPKNTPLMLTDRPWSEMKESQPSGLPMLTDKPWSDMEESQPNGLPMLTDKPWAEIEESQPSRLPMLTDRPWSDIEKSQSNKPLMLTDKPWAEIEEERSSAPLMLTDKPWAKIEEERFQESVKREKVLREKVVLDAKKQECIKQNQNITALSASLDKSDKEAIKQDSNYQKKSKAAKKEQKDTLNYYTARLELLNYQLQCANNRISRKRLQTRLHTEISTTQVLGEFKSAFTLQGTAAYNNISSNILTNKRQDLKDLQTKYKQTLEALAEAHKRVNELAVKGGKYGSKDIRELLSAVYTIIANPSFDIDKNKSALDDAINNFDAGLAKLSRNTREKGQDAAKYEDKLATHSTNDQDARGTAEEAESLREIKALFATTLSDVNNRDSGINNAEVTTLRNQATVLDSYEDRKKEAQAHDLKEKYEGAPYYLDPNTSKIIHRERHSIKRSTGYKSARQLESDYKDEVDQQYKASKALWCKYLGYTNGTGAARVTRSSAGHDGVHGHHTVFLEPYSDIINAKTQKASDPTAANKSAASLMSMLYPSNGTGGAHYTLEFSDPNPHAYRGGPTVKGSQYSGLANNDPAWIAAKNHMEQQQTAEESRVLGKIQTAIADHMKVVHHLDPTRRQ